MYNVTGGKLEESREAGEGGVRDYGRKHSLTGSIEPAEGKHRKRLPVGESEGRSMGKEIRTVQGGREEGGGRSLEKSGSNASARACSGRGRGERENKQ